MATLRLAVIAAKAQKDGRNKVRVALAHNGETRYITTDVTINSLTEFRNGQVVKRHDASYLNTKLRATLQRYQEALDDIPYSAGMTCTELVEMVRHLGVTRHITLQEAFNEYLATANISEGSCRTYEVFFNIVARHMPANTKLELLTPYSIASLDKKLRVKKLSNSTICGCMTTLGMLINYSIKNGYLSYRIHPFANYTKPKIDVRDAWLTTDDIKAIRDCELKGLDSYVRDVFMLSYYLGGINYVDLIKLDLTKDKVAYTRQKIANRANVPVTFDMSDEAKEVAARVMAFKKRDRAKHDKERFRYCLPRIAEKAGINKRLIFYSARKSFAQHAFDLGVDRTIIDYILGHSQRYGNGVLCHYIAVTPEMATKAMRKVLDYLK